MSTKVWYSVTYQEKVENIGILDFSCLFVCLFVYFWGFGIFSRITSVCEKNTLRLGQSAFSNFHVSDKVVHNLIWNPFKSNTYLFECFHEQSDSPEQLCVLPMPFLYSNASVLVVQESKWPLRQKMNKNGCIKLVCISWKTKLRKIVIMKNNS